MKYREVMLIASAGYRKQHRHSWLYVNVKVIQTSDDARGSIKWERKLADRGALIVSRPRLPRTSPCWRTRRKTSGRCAASATPTTTTRSWRAPSSTRDQRWMMRTIAQHSSNVQVPWATVTTAPKSVALRTITFIARRRRVPLQALAMKPEMIYCAKSRRRYRASIIRKVMWSTKCSPLVSRLNIAVKSCKTKSKSWRLITAATLPKCSTIRRPRTSHNTAARRCRRQGHDWASLTRGSVSGALSIRPCWGNIRALVTLRHTAR